MGVEKWSPERVGKIMAQNDTLVTTISEGNEKDRSLAQIQINSNVMIRGWSIISAQRHGATKAEIEQARSNGESFRREMAEYLEITDQLPWD